MTRALGAFVLLTVALVFASQACARANSTGDALNTPGAEATNVRRTSVALVQQIIANNPSPTATLEPTATPSPTCKNAIWWNEALNHRGEARTVQGTIVGTRPAPQNSVLLEIGQPYPDPTGLAVVVPAASASTLTTGRTVCVVGRITLAEGRPAMLVQDATNVVVVN